MHKTICIGYDTPHPDAFGVARHSIQRRCPEAVPIVGIELGAMQKRGLYTRGVERRYYADGSSLLHDPISEAPMATEFAISRFLTPFLAKWRGWAVFMDCDVLVLTDINNLFSLLDDRYAVMCVKLDYQPKNRRKMDNQVQSFYGRKLWSSVMAFNCDHQANRALTLQLINAVPGRDLHRFCWLPDTAIGELPPEWNWIENTTPPTTSPALVHFTEGGPWLHNYEQVAFSNEWRRERSLWIAGDEAAI